MNIQMHNNNNLILPASNEVKFGNGLAVSEQRGKRDLVWGFVLEGNHKGETVLYPMYAADIIPFEVQGETRPCHIIKDDDIVMSRN